MKAVLISIKPKWCNLIVSGKKTLELRKTVPKLPLPFKCYIYMTKGFASYPISNGMMCHNTGGGVVIGEFVCDFILPLHSPFRDKTEGTCLTARDMYEYAAGKNLYGWHISDLVVYDKPKALSEFYKVGTLNVSDWEYQLYDGSGDPSRISYASYLFTRAMRKPPQSWCYVEG